MRLGRVSEDNRPLVVTYGSSCGVRQLSRGRSQQFPPLRSSYPIPECHVADCLPILRDFPERFRLSTSGEESPIERPVKFDVKSREDGCSRFPIFTAPEGFARGRRELKIAPMPGRVARLPVTAATGRVSSFRARRRTGSLISARGDAANARRHATAAAADQRLKAPQRPARSDTEHPHHHEARFGACAHARHQPSLS